MHLLLRLRRELEHIADSSARLCLVVFMTLYSLHRKSGLLPERQLTVR